MSIINTKDQLTAYHWIKGDGNDPTLQSEESKKQRQFFNQTLKDSGFRVLEFNNESFYEHIRQDRSVVSLVIISGHGHVQRLDDLCVKKTTTCRPNYSIGNTKKTKQVTHNQFMKDFRSILSDETSIILAACLTGNKSRQNNFARTLSQSFPNVRVHASQLQVIDDPWIHFLNDSTGKVSGISEVMFASTTKDYDPIRPHPAIVYKNGDEETDQTLVPLSKSGPIHIPDTREIHPHRLVHGALIMVSAIMLLSIVSCSFL